MKRRMGTGLSIWVSHLAIVAVLAVSTSTHAQVTWDMGNWSGSWNNTISYGISWRAEDRDPALVGKGNGGTGEAILTDDGNLNFDKNDVFSNIIKGTSELEITDGRWGGFARIKYWYDFELQRSRQPHGHGPNDYRMNWKLDDSEFADFAKFKGLELLDLFVYGAFDLGDNPLDVRIGRQVVNWGESTFIQGINVLNPIDVSAFRRPGAEIKEGLLPVGLVYGNLGLAGGWSIEAYYQFEWEQTVIDGCGTYFSDADFAAQGCNELLAPEVFLDLGIPGVPGFWLSDQMLQNVNNIRKDPNIDEADDGGQFGLAVRKYVEQIDTEFGFYYQRLHSRTPVLGVRFTNEAIAAGSILAGQPNPTYYRVYYPEDIDIWGLSFATNVGPVALSGELSMKLDMPVGVNGTTALTGGLGIFASAQLGLPPGAFCALPDPTLVIGQFANRACAAWGQYLATGDGESPAFDRFDVTQAQSTAIYFWDQGLGSQRVTFIGEVAWIGVDNLPSIAEMPYGRNPIFGAPATKIGGPNDEGFVTSSSWGYRLRASANYPNVFAGVELTPSIAWAHDVNGTSPTPTFSDGRKAFSLALGANYLTRYRGSISYTWFTGGVANSLEDRDFYSITFSVDF